jgi:hypothetical protein
MMVAGRLGSESGMGTSALIEIGSSSTSGSGFTKSGIPDTWVGTAIPSVGGSVSSIGALGFKLTPHWPQKVASV